MRTIVEHLFIGADGLAGAAIPDLCLTVVGKPFLVSVFANGNWSGSFNLGWNGQFTDESSFFG